MVTDAPSPTGDCGVYLHFPFCAIRCSYCDFATVAGRDDRIEAYLAALHRELELFQLELPAGADTIFIGGGTPSRMTPDQVEGLIAAVGRRFELDPACEITIEGNPESLEPDRLLGYRQAGVNRVSIGVQSLDDGVLSGVGRAHSAQRALEAIESAVGIVGLEVNVDLIAGLPGERLDSWTRTLERLASFPVDHVSVYLLETDKETPLARSIRAGRVTPHDEARLADAYEQTVSCLAAHGLKQYEISNFCRLDRLSRHNVKYWTEAEYGGFGLGAHGYARGRRRGNTRALGQYIEALERGQDPLEREEPWDASRRLDEAMFLGMRMVCGVDVDWLGRRYATDVRARYASAMTRAEQNGLLEWADSTVRLTSRGRLLSNSVFSEFLQD